MIVYILVPVFLLGIVFENLVVTKEVLAGEKTTVKTNCFSSSNTLTSGTSADYLMSGSSEIVDGIIRLVPNRTNQQGAVRCNRLLSGTEGFSAAFKLHLGDGVDSNCGNFEFLLTGSNGMENNSVGIDLFYSADKRLPTLALRIQQGDESSLNQTIVTDALKEDFRNKDIYVWIDYQSTTKKMKIYFSYTNVRLPDGATYSIDLGSYIGTSYYASFSAANGIYSQQVNLCSFVYESGYTSTGVDMAEFESSSTPSPEITTIPVPFPINKVNHTLKVIYEYASGESASTTVTQSIYEGEEYSIISPEISGFSPNIPSVTGLMGTEDITVTVVYTQLISSNQLPGSPGADQSSQTQTDDVWQETDGVYKNISKPLNIDIEEWDQSSIAGVSISAFQMMMVGEDGYELNSAYIDFFKELVNSETVTAKQVIDKLGTMSNQDILTFVQKAITYTKQKHITAVSSVTGQPASYSMSLDCARRYKEGEGYYGGYGYYVLYSTDNAGTEYALAEITADNANRSVYLKGNSLTLTKEAGKQDYAMNEDITYTISSTIPNLENATHIEQYQYNITDTLSEGITVNNDSIVVKTVDENKEVITLTKDDYQVVMNGQTMTITFDFANGPTLKDNMQKGKTIMVTYKATLNQQAVIGGTGNVSSAHLTYTQNAAEESYSTKDTVDDSVIVYTYQMQLTQTGSDGYLLEGAEFEVYDQAGNKVLFKKNESGNYYPVKDSGESTIKTGADGKVSVIGLKGDKYTMKEEKAPEGYQIIPAFTTTIKPTYQDEALTQLSVAIDDSTYIKSADCYIEYGRLEVLVANPLKFGLLPMTGGRGRIIVYFAGGTFLFGGICLAVRKKHKERNKEGDDAQ